MTDRERIAFRTVIATVFLLLVATSLLFASVQQEEVAQRFVPDRERPVRIEVRGDGAEVEIATVREGREGRARYRFTPNNFEGSLHWDAEENLLSAVLDVRNLASDEEGDQRSDLDILIPRTSTVDLDFSIKGGVLDLNGEGMRFADISVEMWGGELAAEFPTPSAEPLEHVNIDVKMGEIRIEGLGNLAFDQLDINGFAGDMRVDFNGSVKRERFARIDLEFGTMTVIVPKGMAVRARIAKWGFLADVSIPAGWGRDGRYAFSPSSRDQDVELNLDIRGGVGEIRIIER